MVENDKWRTEYIYFFIRSCSMRSSTAIFAEKACLMISLVVKTPLHEFMVVVCSGFWYPS